MVNPESVHSGPARKIARLLTAAAFGRPDVSKCRNLKKDTDETTLRALEDAKVEAIGQRCMDFFLREGRLSRRFREIFGSSDAPVSPSKVITDVLLDVFFSTKLHRISPATAEGYRKDSEHFLRWLHALEISFFSCTYFQMAMYLRDQR